MVCGICLINILGSGCNCGGLGVWGGLYGRARWLSNWSNGPDLVAITG